MRLLTSVIAVALFGATIYSPKWACAATTVLDFDSFSATDLAIEEIVPIPESVITDQFRSSGVVFGRDGVSSGVAVVDSSDQPEFRRGIAGLDANGVMSRAESWIYFRFVVPGTDVAAVTDSISFVVGNNGGEPDEFEFEVHSYGLDGENLDISGRQASGERYIPLSLSLAGVHRVEIDLWGSAGYHLADLSFTTPVPEPSSSLILASGCFAILRRRL